MKGGVSQDAQLGERKLGELQLSLPQTYLRNVGGREADVGEGGGKRGMEKGGRRKKRKGRHQLENRY